MPRKSKKSTVEGAAGHFQSAYEGRAFNARPPSPDPSAGGRPRRADQASVHMSPAADTIAQIRYWHRQRCFAMEQRKRLDLALGSFLRLMLGWSRDLPDKERKAISDGAAAIVDAPEGTEWEAVVRASVAAREPFAKIEARALKEMSKLAETLPAWTAFGEGVRGFGSASLAVVVAEAGDLSLYANPGKLWKRMGLAVMGSVRQGGLPKNASADAWIEHGYNRQRRSRMWNIGDALIKGNRDGEYRTIYLARKEYELARDPEMKPIKAHRRAQRYMEKRLLRNLWQAWRRAGRSAEPRLFVPAAPNPPQGGPQASYGAKTLKTLPAAILPATEAGRSAIHVAKSLTRVPSATLQAAE